MKDILTCGGYNYVITDQDHSILLTISPNFARLARESDQAEPTHFVCELCGQIAPVRLRELHICVRRAGRAQPMCR